MYHEDCKEIKTVVANTYGVLLYTRHHFNYSTYWVLTVTLKVGTIIFTILVIMKQIKEVVQGHTISN